MKTDTDVVIAWYNGEVIFMKTFDIKTEREEMLKAYDVVSSDNFVCDSYRMCGIERLDIDHS